MELKLKCPSCAYLWKEDSEQFIRNIKEDTKKFLNQFPENIREEITNVYKTYDNNPIDISEEKVIKIYEDKGEVISLCRRCQFELTLESLSILRSEDNDESD